MADNSKTKNLLLLFDRPTEPVFVPKGDKKAVFNVPNEYLTERYKPIGVELTTRFGGEGGEKIKVNPIRVPDMSEIMQLGRRQQFSVFIPKHMRLASQLIDIFMGMKNVDDLTSCAVYARDRVNPFLFNYALSVALLHRPDTQGVEIPNFMQTFPEKFVDSKIFSRAREEANVVPQGSRMPIEITRDFTASDLEPENRISYFREDIGLGLHHWHWHLVYPFGGRREIVAKDRRGELFFYMHQQMIARYNVERFCNKLSRVERLNNFREPLKEAYFPKLDSLVASRAWPARSPNVVMQNLNRSADNIKQDVDDLQRWTDRLFEAIHSGIVRMENGSQMELTEVDGVDMGIDMLGNMVEASPVLSPNFSYYGNMHNMGHMFIAYIHDPDHRYLEDIAVMGDTGLNVRDPIFYRWHSFIDDIFQQYKVTIPTYPVERLDNPNITISSTRVEVENGPVNTLQTFWQKSDVDLSRGLDFAPRGPVAVRFTHLQHSPFTYRITANNSSNAEKRGTVRIFIAPKNDERGVPMTYDQQRIFFIELDKFTTTLTPGTNEITRRSTESSVTIPFERTFRNLDLNRPVGGDALEQFNFCGCGWPQHMLIPKGTPEGYPCVLFVMISNIDDDVIQQTLDGPCSDSASYCGIKDKKYPDKRSMGYPFDRRGRNGVTTIEEFVTPNMSLTDVTIRFTDRTVIRGQSRNN